MRDKAILSEECIGFVNYDIDEPDEPAAPNDGGGFSEAFQITGNMFRIKAKEIYRSLETLLERIPAVRDAFGIDTDDVPKASSVCKWVSRPRNRGMTTAPPPSNAFPAHSKMSTGVSAYEYRAVSEEKHTSAWCYRPPPYCTGQSPQRSDRQSHENEAVVITKQDHCPRRRWPMSN